MPDATHPVGRLLFNVLVMVAELTVIWTTSPASAPGRGWPSTGPRAACAVSSPSSPRSRKAHLVALYRAGQHTVGELEELFSITRSTVYRAVRRDQARNDPAASATTAA